MGARVKLHICGDISKILEHVSLSGADIIDIDWMVDFKEAVRVLDGSASVCGNFDPVRILLQGTRKDVENSVQECLEAADCKTFIAAGCEVPKYTLVENIKAVHETLCSFSSLGIIAETQSKISNLPVPFYTFLSTFLSNYTSQIWVLMI